MGQRQDAIHKLRHLIQDEKDLYVGTDDDSILLAFLYAKNFDVEKAFDQMKTWYQLKADHSEFFAFRRAPVHDRIMNLGDQVLLENRDQLGRRIFIMKMSDLQVYDAEFTPELSHQVYDIWLTLALDEEETRENGLIVLIDLKTMNWSFTKLFTYSAMSIVSKKTEAVPIGNVECHYVNGGTIFYTISHLVMPFLKSETKNNIYFHKTLESLHSYVSPSALPLEYGGVRETPVVSDIIDNYVNPRNKRLAELLSYGYKKKSG